MRIKPITHISALLLLLWTASANAVLIDWTVSLDGSQEVPPVVSPGNGTGFGTLDTLTNELTWSIEVQDLLGDIVAAHFHQAPVGVNGGAIVDLFSFEVVLGGNSGTFMGSTIIDAAQTMALLQDGLYINVHTDQHPPGEVRGQVLPQGAIPNPGSWFLLAIGLLGVAVIRKGKLHPA